MRSAALHDCLQVLQKYQIDPSRGLVIDVGGTETVYLDGVLAPNPLKALNPDTVFLDKGFNIEFLGTDAHEVIDFLDLKAISHLHQRFDLVFCFDTLEHVPNPFQFCEHLVYITRPGGHVYVSTVFEWSYHPSPEDYFRFSPAGLRECFESPLNKLSGEFRVLWCGWESDGKGVSLLGRREENLLAGCRSGWPEG